MAEKIPTDFFLNDALWVAKNLLGKILVRKINGQEIKARIVETEAYLGENDAGSHSYRGKKTPRTAVYYHPGGIMYFYLIYGMYYCFNIVVNTSDKPEAVLIRAVEIISGHEVVSQYFSLKKQQQKPEKWTNGPGKLTLALQLDQKLNNFDILANDNLTIVQDDFVLTEADIVAAKRVNLNCHQEARDQLWRFYLKNNRYVSQVTK